MNPYKKRLLKHFFRAIFFVAIFFIFIKIVGDFFMANQYVYFFERQFATQGGSYTPMFYTVM